MPDARGEAGYAAEFFRWFAEETVRTPGDFRKSPSGDKRILVLTNLLGFLFLLRHGTSQQVWQLARSVQQLLPVAQ